MPVLPKSTAFITRIKSVMMKKILSFLLLFMAVMVFATWQYRLLCLLFFVLLNRKWIKSLSLMRGRKYAYRFLLISILIGILISVPNYFQRGRTQLIYMDSNGHKTATPLNIYAGNALFPEEEVMNLCMKATAILPPSELSPIFKNLGSRFIRDAQRDFWKGKAFGFYSPSNKLLWQGSNTGSFTIASSYNVVLGEEYNSADVRR